jgi:excisionase family DNA binding protein
MKTVIIVEGMAMEDFVNLISTRIVSELKASLQILQDQSDNQLMTRKEVAKMFDISLATLSSWCKKGKIPFKQLGNRVYFRKGDLLAKLEKLQKYGRL